MAPLLLHCSSRLPQPSSAVMQFSTPRHRTTARLLPLNNSGAPSTPRNSRFNNSVKLKLKQSSFVVFASNTDPSAKDSLEKQQPSDGVETGNAGLNPPFLTILAGFLVLLLVFWIIGSVVMWLISFLTSFVSSK